MLTKHLHHLGCRPDQGGMTKNEWDGIKKGQLTIKLTFCVCEL